MQVSRNFSFLAVHDRELVVLGTFAERYYAEDPNTCLMKLRQYGELLAQLTAAHYNLPAYAGESQNDLLKRLRRKRLSPRVLDLFHWLRKQGNDAVHDRVGSHQLALAHLRYAHQLAIWFHQTFGDTSFQPQVFIPPPAGGADAAIQAQIAQLRQAAQVNQQAAESAQAVAAEESQRRQVAEAHAQTLSEKLKALQAAAANQSPRQQQETRQRSQTFAEAIELTEREVRQLIDQQLRRVGWEADTENLRHAKGTRPEVGRNLAIAEYPMGGNRKVDYVLFVGNTLMAVLEAKAKDAIAAQTQTSVYVSDAAGTYNVFPFAFFSDYTTTYFWEMGTANKRLVAGVFSPEDLVRLAHIRTHQSPLASVQPNLATAAAAGYHPQG
ncbi:MAG: type I restriction endonuclease [Cyanobacteria bacterium J06635_1]